MPKSLSHTIHCAAPYYDHNVLGGMYYRAGQYERAVDHLQKSIGAYPSDAPPAYGTVFQPKLFLAMTYWKMNEHDEARRLLTETKPAIDEWLQSPLHFWTRPQFTKCSSVKRKP